MTRQFEHFLDLIHGGVEHDAPAEWFGMVLKAWEPEIRKAA
jgi:hypothetical protein